MHSAALQKHLLRLFQQHQIELEPDEDDWLVTEGDFPAIRASWSDGVADQPGRLDIDVVLDEARQIEESFAGVGAGEAGWRDAMASFERSALPVLLAACWYVTDQRKLTIEAWEIGLRTFDVFVGPYAEDVPVGVIEQVTEAFKRDVLSPELHWLRWFYRRDADGVGAVEVLRDNQPWAAAEQALASLAWPTEPGYRARGLLMLDVRDY
ncbi:MAG: DUF6348 family protein [Dyella sp.]